MLGAGNGPSSSLNLDLRKDDGRHGGSVPKSPSIPFIPKRPRHKHEERCQSFTPSLMAKGDRGPPILGFTEGVPGGGEVKVH